MDTALTKSERETLKAIYRLTSGQGGSAGVPAAGVAAHTGDLADNLGVSPGTMTAVVKRLADRGLVDYTPYRGVELTSVGRQSAVSVIRRHRIVERFLSDMLGYAWNEADRLAPSFEHELPQEVEDRMFAALHRPSTCPHGFPIPEAEGTDIPAMPSLYALEPGDVAVVAMSGSTDRDMITFLETLGLRPGVVVEVKEKHPFDGPLVLRVDGQDRTLGERVAHQIFVRKAPAAATNGSTIGTADDHEPEYRKEPSL
jgi:DtxR family transcriptional regulator, Mn-dependent transcriptional regulator